MAEKSWEVIKVRYCQHVAKEVGLEVEAVYPAEWMPDQPARIVAHRCSHAFACSLDTRPACVWAGSNPAYDPFKED
jgi:hypothetical protein